MAYQIEEPDQLDYTKTGVKGLVTYDSFGCNVFAEHPPTPDRLDPDVVYRLATHSDARLQAPDGKEIRFWGFFNPDSSNPAERTAPYPSPMIRVRKGQVVHIDLFDTEHGAHTIHFHAIEPTTMNDGVGHTSFEVNDRYVYQWQAAEEGTYFYHCHRNTVHHMEMGMFGPLIVDPPEGPGRLYSGGPRYHVERTWFVDDVDLRWHEQNFRNHDQGMCGEDVGFNRFEPKYFLVNGVFNDKTMTDPRVMSTSRLGQRVLIRIVNASYSVLRITLGINARLVGADGRMLGRHPWNRTVNIPANSPQILTTAGRFDFLITPTRRGNYPVKMEFIDWITGLVQDDGRGVVDTQIKVR